MNKSDAGTEYEVTMFWDDEAGVWVAISDDLNIALESESIEALINRVKKAAPEILVLNNVPTQGPICLAFKIQYKL